MFRAAAVLFLLASSPLAADQAMSPSEFDAYVTGETLYYGKNGTVYGIEQYLPGRRVRWSFLDGDCVEGYWFPRDGQICFTYDDLEETQCWEFRSGSPGLSARLSTDPPDQRLYEIFRSPEPMVCKGPRIGV